jgi:iron complex outermembrane receptor protein
MSLLALALFASHAVAAPIVDPFNEPDDADLFRQEEQIVTVASRTAQAVDDAPAIVTLVTDRQIRERGYRTLADVLRALPGVYVTVSDESRSVAWVRGVTSPDNNKILLLVDGQPWFDGVYGHAWIDGFLPLDQVRQVEIIKGPGSAIYGTNAFAAVVNVVTYKPDELRGGFVRVTGGTHSDTGLSVVGGGPLRMGDTDGAVSAWVRTVSTEGDGLDVTPRGRRNVSGNDPERGVGAGARIRVGALDVRYDLYGWKHSYFVNEQDDPLDVLTQNVDNFWLAYLDQGVRISADLQGNTIHVVPRAAWRRHDHPGQYGWFGDPVTTLATTTDPTTSVTTSTASTRWDTTLVETFKQTSFLEAGVDVDARLGARHEFVGGFGGDLVHVERIQDVTYEDQSHEPVGTDTYTAPERWIPEGFVYGQDTWEAAPWLEVTAGARMDLHGFYGAFPSPRAGLLLSPTATTGLKVLYGRAFRAPNARELLVEVTPDAEGQNPYTSGNPDLSPEQIQTVEAELTWRPRRGMLVRAAGFSSRVRDTIDRKFVETADPRLGDLYYANFGGADVLGAEAQVVARLGALELDGSYSWTHATDLDTGFAVYEFPPHMAHLRAGWTVQDALRWNVTGHYAGTRPRAEWSPDAGLRDADGYVLVDVGLATESMADGRVRVDVSVTNVLDSAWSTLVYRDDANALNGDGTPRYPNDLEGPGRQARVGVEFTF